MRERKPNFVVELGAGSGLNTEQIVKLQNEFPFKMTVVNDGHTPEADWLDKVNWINGVSYVELPMIAEKIDFCSIDTDHNYWTLREELTLLELLMDPGSIVVMHDTETYGHHSGHFFIYVTKNPYPLEQIEACEEQGLNMIDAITERVDRGAWKIIKETKDNEGAMALERL